MTPSNANPTGRLIAHFDGCERGRQSEGWSQLWESGQSDLWDRETPSLALINFLESSPAVINERQDGSRRLRALVPGCGKGYDVAMLALHGFDVYGLEVSEVAADTARDYVTSQIAEPNEYNFGSRDYLPAEGYGKIQIVAGDFFQRDWELTCANGDAIKFDIIYDYTFLCALLPEMRHDWAYRISQLLEPTGVLICLEFPLYRDLKETGPPWGLRGVYWNLLAQGGDGLVYEPREEIESSAGAFKRVLYFAPRESYPNGKGTDMMSVWMLK